MDTTDVHEMPRMRRYVDAPTIADMLGVDRRTIDKLIAEEGLPCTRITERLRRFDLDAVYAWIDSRWSHRTPGEAA